MEKEKKKLRSMTPQRPLRKSDKPDPYMLSTPQKDLTVPYRPANKLMIEKELIRRDEKVKPSSINMDSLVDLDILYKFNEYLRSRPEDLAVKIVRSCNRFPDRTGMISWENYLNFHVIVCMGKGTKD